MKPAYTIILLSICMTLSVGCRRTERSDLFNRSSSSSSESTSDASRSHSKPHSKSKPKSNSARPSKALAGQLNLKATSPVQNRLIEALGVYLSESGFLDGAPRDMMVDRRGPAHIISLVASRDHRDESFFKDFASELSREVFEGGAVDIHLCQNADFRPYAIITAHDLGTLKRFNALALYYTDNVKPQRATQLGERLKRAGLAEGGSVSVQLTRGEGGVYQAKLAVLSDLKLDEYDDVFKQVHAELKSSLFKEDSFELHASDAFFKTLKVYR